MPLLPSCHVSCSKRDGTWVQQSPTLSRDSSARESEREREREREITVLLAMCLWSYEESELSNNC
jgi:hypothetical protein